MPTASLLERTEWFLRNHCRHDRFPAHPEPIFWTGRPDPPHHASRADGLPCPAVLGQQIPPLAVSSKRDTPHPRLPHSEVADPAATFSSRGPIAPRHSVPTQASNKLPTTGPVPRLPSWLSHALLRLGGRFVSLPERIQFTANRPAAQLRFLPSTLNPFGFLAHPQSWNRTTWGNGLTLTPAGEPVRLIDGGRDPKTSSAGPHGLFHFCS